MTPYVLRFLHTILDPAASEGLYLWRRNSNSVRANLDLVWSNGDFPVDVADLK